MWKQLEACALARRNHTAELLPIDVPLFSKLLREVRDEDSPKARTAQVAHSDETTIDTVLEKALYSAEGKRANDTRKKARRSSNKTIFEL